MSFADRPYIVVCIFGKDTINPHLSISIDQGMDRNHCYPLNDHGQFDGEYFPCLLNNRLLLGITRSIVEGLIIRNPVKLINQGKTVAIQSYLIHTTDRGRVHTAQSELCPHQPREVASIVLPSLNPKEILQCLDLIHEIGHAVFKYLPVSNSEYDYDRDMISLPKYVQEPDRSLVVTLTDREVKPAIRMEAEDYQYSPSRRAYRKYNLPQKKAYNDNLFFDLGLYMAQRVLSNRHVVEYPHWPLIDLFVELVEEDGRQVIVMTEDVKAEAAHHRDFLEELPLESVHFNPDKDYTNDHIHYGRLILKHLGLCDG